MDNEIMVQDEAEITEPQIAKASKAEFFEYIESLKNSEDDEGEVREENPMDKTDESDKDEEADDAEDKIAPEEEKKFTQSDVDAIIGKRLKEKREAQGISDELIREALDFYDTDDKSEVIRLLIEDMRMQNAQKLGMEKADYTEMRSTQDKAKKYDEITQREAQKQKKTQEFIDRWTRESEEIKEIVPDFDFDRAMSTNKVFREAILSGKSVQTAYLLSSRQTEKPKRQTVKQNAQTAPRATAKADFNPSTASEKEFREYIRRIKQNE